MVTLTVAVLLLILSAPMLSGLIADVRLSGITNSLISHLQFARSEAIKRGRGRIAVGPYFINGASGALAWADTQSWSHGYLVAAVDNASPPRILTGGILRIIDASELALVTMTKNGGVPRYTFSPDGSAGGIATITICDTKTPNHRRGVLVDLVGRIRATEQGLDCD